MLFCMDGVFCISVYCYDTAWTGHLDLEVSIVWYIVESGKRGSSEQCVIAVAEGDNVED